MRLACAALLGLCCALAAGARAQDEAPLGTPGQWLLGGSAGATLQWENWEQPRPPASQIRDVQHVEVWIAPKALLFVADDFALGAELWLGIDRYEHEDDLGFSSDGVGGSALFAYRGALAEGLFLFPELALGAAHTARSARPPADGFGVRDFIALDPGFRSWSDTTVVHATLSLPLALSLAPKFFIGFGPYLRARWSPHQVTPRGDEWSVAFGLSTLLGTWL